MQAAADCSTCLLCQALQLPRSRAPPAPCLPSSIFTSLKAKQRQAGRRTLEDEHQSSKAAV